MMHCEKERVELLTEKKTLTMEKIANGSGFLLVLLLITGLVWEAFAVEVGKDGVSNGSSTLGLTTESVLLSVGVLCTLVLVVFGCTWAWWHRVFCFWKSKGTHEAPPDWFTSSGNPHFATLDPANLPRDAFASGRHESITIDPLPTLNDLGINGRDSFELRTFPTPSIIEVGLIPHEDFGGGHDIAVNVRSWDKTASFPRTNLEYQKIIGKGWFGKILEARASNIKPYIQTSNVIVRELRNNASDQDSHKFLTEARVYKHAQEQRCEHVMKLLGYCVEVFPYIVIFEYFPLGDLKTYLKGKARIAPGELKAGEDGMLTRMIIDIIRGVKWMHDAGFVHGDLAARNILVANDAGKVVIGDYGNSAQKYKTDYFWSASAGCAIPIRWSAPEILSFDDTPEGAPPPYGAYMKLNEITQSSNIWSLGVVIWEVFQLGKQPYENLTDDDVIRRIIRQNSYILEPPQLSFVKNETKDRIYQLLVSCWNTTPNHRPSIEQIEQVFTTP